LQNAPVYGRSIYDILVYSMDVTSGYNLVYFGRGKIGVSLLQVELSELDGNDTAEPLA
jgi:hypothetical protein